MRAPTALDPEAVPEFLAVGQQTESIRMGFTQERRHVETTLRTGDF